MKNEKKLNNKGFSLVELIIVIAIMAVLVAVLAPQYMKFVERGRVASDRDNISAMVSAIQVHAVDIDRTENYAAAGGTGIQEVGTITVERPAASGAADNTKVAGSAEDAIREALENAGLPHEDADIPRLTNKETFSKVVVTVKWDYDKKIIIVETDET